MAYKVTHTNLLVEVVPEEQEGIVSSEETQVVRGRVKEMGSGKNVNGVDVGMVVHPGMHIWFNKFEATEFKEFYVVPQSIVIAYEED